MHYPQYPESYYANSRNITLNHPQLENTQQCDVCVIGAGFTGISTALSLAQKGYKVIVLEEKRVGWGASGRNGGQVSGNYDGGMEGLNKHVNAAELQTFWDMAEQGKQLIRQRVKQYHIQCDIKPGTFVGAYTHRHEKKAKLRLQQADNFGYHALRWIEKNEVPSIVDNPSYIGGVLDEDAFHLHPLNLVLGEAAAAANLGVNIFENAAVININNGARPCVQTANAEIHCKNVVVCGDGYLALSNKLPTISSKVLPVSTYIIATQRLKPALAKQLIPQNHGISDCRHFLDFYRLSADNRLLFGGGSRFGGDDPTDIIAWRQPTLLKHFPQLKHTAIEYSWGGVMGFTDNNKPHLERKHNNIYIAQGFSGHGIALSHIAGDIIAQCIATDNERFDLFSRIKHQPLPSSAWLGKPAVVLTSLMLRLRDAINL